MITNQSPFFLMTEVTRHLHRYALHPTCHSMFAVENKSSLLRSHITKVTPRSPNVDGVAHHQSEVCCPTVCDKKCCSSGCIGRWCSVRLDDKVVAFSSVRLKLLGVWLLHDPTDRQTVGLLSVFMFSP